MRASEREMRAESPAVAYAAPRFEDVVNASLAAGASARHAKVACMTGGLDYALVAATHVTEHMYKTFL